MAVSRSKGGAGVVLGLDGTFFFKVDGDCYSSGCGFHVGDCMLSCDSPEAVVPKPLGATHMRVASVSEGRWRVWKNP